MLSFLIYFAFSVSRPEYFTEFLNLQGANDFTPCWTIDLEKFEQILLAKPTNGQKTRIVLPDYESKYREYEIEPEPYNLYGLATRKKYPNQLFAFRGHRVDKKEEEIGIVYCFQSLKVYFVGHYQRITMAKEVNKITVIDDVKNIQKHPIELPLPDSDSMRKLLQEEFSTHSNRTIKEASTASQDTKEELFDTSFTDTLNDIKVIKLLPFPTHSRIINFWTGLGLDTIGMSEDAMKKNVFSELALEVSYLNRVFLPTLSLRFELQFCMELIVSRNSDDKKKYLPSNKLSPDYNIINNVLKFALNYFESKDIDVGIMLSTAGSSRSGLASNGCFSPHKSSRTGAYITNDYIKFGVAELLMAHELGHCLGAKHSFTHKNDGAAEAIEVASGVTIMGYPGIAQPPQANVEHGAYPYFTMSSLKAISSYIQRNFLTNSVPKTNKKPVINKMKTRFVIPTKTAFLLSGSAWDPENDTLYYNWEQQDPRYTIITHETFNHNYPGGPIIRNYAPTTDPYRFVPRLDRIKQGKLLDHGPNPEAWETVPSVARTMLFAFVVMDRKLLSDDAGNTALQMVGIKVVETGNPFAITSFNTATTIRGGESQNIQWDVAGTDSGEINTKTVTIKFASDGVHFNQVLAANVQNNGNACVTFPTTRTTTGRIMIQGDDNIFIAITL